MQLIFEKFDAKGIEKYTFLNRFLEKIFNSESFEGINRIPKLKKLGLFILKFFYFISAKYRCY
jgi:hypothetical protein